MSELLKKPYIISLWKDQSVYIVEDIGGARREIFDLALKTADEELKNHVYREVPLCVIGSSQMDSPVRAYNPKLTQNLNGSNTLTFSINYKFYDEDLEDFRLNPFINVLQNEQKVKLKYGDKWFHFLIKQVDENSENNTFSFTCTDQYINELSKAGYEIELATELENSIGTAEELGASILEGSDWRIKPASEDDRILQKNRVSLVKYQLPFDLYATAMLDKHKGQPIEKEITVKADQVIYICYNDVVKQSPRFQFFYCEWITPDFDPYEPDEDGVITGSPNYIIDNDWDWETNPIPLKITSEYYGNMLVSQPIVEYFSELDKYCSLWTKTDEDAQYWAYTDTIYASVADIRDILTNGQNFTSTLGWVGEGDTTVTLSSSIENKIQDTNTPLNTIKVNFSGEAPVVNTGFYDNRALFDGFKAGEEFLFAINTNGTSNYYVSSTTVPGEDGNVTITTKLTGLDENHTYGRTFRWYLNGELKDTEEVSEQITYRDHVFTGVKPSDSNIFRVEIYNIENTVLYAKYSCTSSEYSGDYSAGKINKIFVREESSEQVPNTEGTNDSEFLLNFKDQILEDSGDFPEVLTGYKLYRAKIKKSVSKEELSKLVYDFCMTGEGTIYIYDSKLFRAEKDLNGKYIIPDLGEDLSTLTRVKYNFFSDFRDSDEASTINIKNLPIIETVDEEDLSLRKYEAVYDKTYEKIGTVEGSKSNRFNLIQEICETFECWADFEIEVDPESGTPLYQYEVMPTDGKTPVPHKVYYVKVGAGEDDIDFDVVTFGENASFKENVTYYERNYLKWVSFKPYIGAENWAGFRYGVNLKGIQRKNDSNQIVSKLIVQSNANQYALDGTGSCSIQTATLNPTGETAIYNFEYYIKQRMLSRDDLNMDLYGDPTHGGMRYFSTLYDLNKQAQPFIEQYVVAAATRSSLISDVTVFEALIEEAEAKKEEYIQSIADALGITVGEAATKDISDQYNDEVNSYILKRDQSQTYIANYTIELEKAKSLLEDYDTECTSLTNEIKYISDKKNDLHKAFYKKYSRFIQEGTWTSEEYIDSDLYYLDANHVLYTSAFPKVTYTINVLEISQVEGYENYDFKIGDKTYIEDIEFFGYKDDKITPYREEIVVSQVVSSLDDPTQNKITVQNYKTQFEDLFQRITATTTSLQYAQGEYKRAATAVNADGTLSAEYLKNSLEKNTSLIMSSPNGELVFDQDKGEISIKSIKGNVLINSLGILVGSGNKYQTAISAEGINANVITTGRLNTSQIVIYGDSQETFRWDKNGLSAFAFSESGTNFNQYVRFDKYGIYGSIGNGSNWVPGSIQDIEDSSIFSLTWKGLALNATDGKGYVRLSTEGTEIGDKKKIIWSGNKETNKNGLEYEDDKFAVYSDGSVFMAGTVTADSVMVKNDEGKYVSVFGEGDGKVYLEVDSGGSVTISGNINMTGGSISWSNVDGGFPGLTSLEPYGIYKITGTTLNQAEIRSPKIYASEFYAGGESLTFAKIEDEGFFVYVGSEESELVYPKIELKISDRFDSEGNTVEIPSLILGQGTSGDLADIINIERSRGAIVKLKQGLWIGNNAIYNTADIEDLDKDGDAFQNSANALKKLNMVGLYISFVKGDPRLVPYGLTIPATFA